MKREQVEKGKVIVDKLETIERAMAAITSTINEKQGITLSTSFTSKFRDELIIWMDQIQKNLEKELESL